VEYERNGPAALVQVTPTALESVAGEVQDVAAGYAAAQRPLMDDLRLAEGQFAGWWLGRVFGQLDRGWTDDFRKFDENLQAVADSLTKAASAYREADEVNADLFWYLR
jgi:uncharacterized protein YukE